MWSDHEDNLCAGFSRRGRFLERYCAKQHELSRGENNETGIIMMIKISHLDALGVSGLEKVYDARYNALLLKSGKNPQAAINTFSIA